MSFVSYRTENSRLHPEVMVPLAMFDGSGDELVVVELELLVDEVGGGMEMGVGVKSVRPNTQ